MLIALGVALLAMLILANGYFVAAEFSYVAVNRGRLEELAGHGDRKAQRALRVSERLSFMLSGAQFGITVTSLLVGFVAQPTLGQALLPLMRLVGLPDAAAPGLAFTTAFVLATATQMVVGELAPKNLAIARPEPFARGLAGPTLWYLRISGPLIKLFDGSANRLLRLLGIQPVEELGRGVSPEELSVIIESATREGALTSGQARLLGRALDFRELRAGDAMVPRTHVVSIPAEATCEDLRRLAVDSGHSRFPMVGDGLDDVRGVVQAKDLLTIPAERRASTRVSRLASRTLAVPESAQLGPLLGTMRSARSPLAIVVDEYGGTAGIVTLEDLVEELFGEIRDEYDRAEPAVTALGGGVFRVPGSWRLDEVERDTGLRLPPGEFDTLSGLVMDRLGRVPEPGDELELDGLRLVVESLDGHAVGWARLHRITPGPDEHGEAP